MNLRYRKTVIAGNWKMNKSPAEARKFVLDLKQEAAAASKWCDVVLCVPFLHIPAAVKAAKGTKIAVGAQNCHFEETGAFTGEISCRMLAEAGCKYVIVGHSERRRDFGESDRTVNRKVLAACEAGLRPIVCVGETLDMRDDGVTLDIVRAQVKQALRGVTQEQVRRVVFAYEPVWAIGTGYTATAEQAGEVGAAIRECLRGLYGARIARGISILYGGSMNGTNARELLAQPDVDGGLIGGASLGVETFTEVIEAAHQ